MKTSRQIEKKIEQICKAQKSDAIKPEIWYQLECTKVALRWAINVQMADPLSYAKFDPAPKPERKLPDENSKKNDLVFSISA